MKKLTDKEKALRAVEKLSGILKIPKWMVPKITSKIGDYIYVDKHKIGR